MTIRKSEQVSQTPIMQQEQVFEEVKEQVNTFTISQIDGEIAMLNSQIKTFEDRIVELEAKKAEALNIK